MSASDLGGSETRSGPVRLDVVARDRAAEIVVIDASLVPVARGVGHLSVELPPGIYKARVITGAQVREQFAILAVDRSPVRVEFSPIGFASPAPLDATTKTHEYHMEAAHEHSRRVHVDLGGDSEIFLFLRDYTKRGEVPSAAEELAAGVALVDENGDVLVDFEAVGVRGGTGDAWYACNVVLRAGVYRLVVDTGEERLAQTLVASANWQTQVFLLREPTNNGRGRRPLNMAGAAMFLVRRGQGFHASEESLRVIELARLGLSNQRQVLPREEMDLLLDGKFENPMLGIFAAHLLLLSRSPDQKLLRTVVDNLRRMVGEHPDVEAIALSIGAPQGRTRFAHPPMLARSYWLMIEQSARRPDLVPLGSVTAKIATQLWGGAGPWLVFGEPGVTSALRAFALKLDEMLLSRQVEPLKAGALMPSSGAPHPQRKFRHAARRARNYRLMTELAARGTESVTPESVTLELATQPWQEPSPWRSLGESVVTAVPQAFSLKSHEQLSNKELVEQLCQQDLQKLAEASLELTTAEEAILRYLVPPKNRRFSLPSLSGAPVSDKGYDQERMVRALGLPPATIHEGVRGLLEKAELLGKTEQP